MANNRIGEIRGSVKLAGKAFEHLTARIHEFHRAISDMPFNAMPAVPGVKDGSEGTRLIHDGITDGVYGVIKGIGGALFKQADVALKLAERNFQPATQAAKAITPPAIARDNVVSAISGLIGDAMAQERNPLRVKLGFYREGHRTLLSAPVLEAAYPDATGKLVIFVHGLCCNEHSWRLYAEQNTPYGDQLAGLGYTPLYVRYNSGLHISLNGRTLARQMDKLVSLWPVPVKEVVLIGHSMGGLVARSAAYKAAKSNMTWPAKLSHLLCLGTPHTGAPLEQFVHAATPVLEAFPLSRPLAKVLAVRSEGIRDLRHGFVADEHWKKRTAEERTADARSEIPRLPTVKYHFIGSSIGIDEHHWLGKAIGDGLVKLPSSTARELADADTATLYNAHHMQLLNHPAIYKEIAQRLTAKKAIKQ
ncbi:MAG: alpha/beta hydrolase [Stagnimonas sp.]|nr:alpha/beta hydrolase [Stagnimonas sp.]